MEWATSVSRRAARRTWQCRPSWTGRNRREPSIPVRRTVSFRCRCRSTDALNCFPCPIGSQSCGWRLHRCKSLGRSFCWWWRCEVSPRWNRPGKDRHQIAPNELPVANRQILSPLIQMNCNLAQKYSMEPNKNPPIQNNMCFNWWYNDLRSNDLADNNHDSKRKYWEFKMNYRIIFSFDGFQQVLVAGLAPHAVVFVRVDISIRIHQRDEVEIEIVENAVVLQRIVDQLVDHVSQSGRCDPFSGVDSYQPHKISYTIHFRTNKKTKQFHLIQNS